MKREGRLACLNDMGTGGDAARGFHAGNGKLTIWEARA